jgi:hypothetical protein
VTPAQTHLFGSTDGYRTLARSPDVTDADDAALAALGFGSPRTEEEFALLERELCVAGRALPSGRYAITRVFPGAPDVAGRRTIERRTLILEMREWEWLAGSDLWTTLRDERNWTREAFANGEEVQVRAHDTHDLMPTPGEAERRVFDALLQARVRRRCAGFPNSEPWTSAILRLPNLLPPEETHVLGWGVGLWSVPMGVGLATLHANSEARHAFPAATQGPWQDPESVMQLGQHFVTQRPDPTPAAPRRRRRTIGRHLPMLAGLAAMLLASLMVWWAVQQREALESRARSAQSPPRDLERDIVHGTPVRPSGPPTETPTPPPAQQAEPPRRDAPAPTPAPAEAPSPSTASATAPTAPSAPAPGSDGFGTTSSAAPNDAFGSGTSEAMREEPAPVDMTAAPAPAVATPTPTPAPAPSEKPNIPEAPADSAPWDAEIRLARQAIDLHARAREATTEAQGVALVPILAEHAGALIRAHREIERTAGKSAPSEKCLILIDARNKKRGLTDLVKREQLAQAFSPLIVQRMLLLSARFELSLAVQDLARRQLIDTGAMPKELRGDARVDGWPDDTPWVLWYFRNKDAPVSTASDGARYMASEFDAALNGHPGTRGAQKILESIASRTTGGATP